MNHKKEYNWKVCVQCLTYNHSQFIKSALDGFAMQKTLFPFVTVIVDDASIDGEPDIIRDYLYENFDEPYRNEETEYAQIICAKHKTNSTCEFVAILLKYNHYVLRKSKLQYIEEWRNSADYIALCEGDDFWTNPNKLQIQVDFLETHTNYSAAAHQSELIGARTGVFCDNVPETIFMNDVLSNSRFFHTASIVYRAKRLLELPPIKKPIVSGDKLLILKLSYLGPIKFFNNIMCVYRKHESGMSNTIKYNDLIQDVNIVDYMKSIYPKFPSSRYLSFLYGTICLTAKDASTIQKIKCLFLSFILSFSFFPHNITHYGRKLLNLIKRQ